MLSGRFDPLDPPEWADDFTDRQLKVIGATKATGALGPVRDVVVGTVVVAAGIALILGVDRILDMIRTAVNVTGDLTVAALVAKSEGEALEPRPVDHRIAIGPS